MYAPTAVPIPARWVGVAPVVAALSASLWAIPAGAENTPAMAGSEPLALTDAGAIFDELSVRPDRTGYNFTAEQLAWPQANAAAIARAAQTFFDLPPGETAAVAANPVTAMQVPTAVEVRRTIGDASVLMSTVDLNGTEVIAPDAEQRIESLRAAASTDLDTDA